MEHTGTTAGLISYSKWEINQWGDPTGVKFAPGAWQVVTSAANDVVLGLWGYWGFSGAEGSQLTKIGDHTGYKLTIELSRPVERLSFPVNGINGFLKPVDGFNSGDRLAVKGSLNGTAIILPEITSQGPAYAVRDYVLTGDYVHQINDGISGQHMSDDGSAVIVFDQPVDRVELSLTNTAGHPDPAAFRSGLQTWSFSVGNLSYRVPNERDPLLSGMIQHALTPANSGDHIGFQLTADSTADLALSFQRPKEFAELFEYRLETSADLQSWQSHPIDDSPESISNGVETILIDKLATLIGNGDRGFVRSI